MVREHFVEGLQGIEGRVSDMAVLARAMLKDGVQSLLELDRDLAREVSERRDGLADLDEEIETGILHFLTLQSPVASDLRRIGAALKLITYLNRVGRYGYDIAQVARDWPEGHGHVASLVGLREMAGKVEAMLDQVLDAFRTRTGPDTKALMALENDVDAMRYTIFREALTYMAEDPKHIEPCAHYMMAARYLERCGDNIVKMAEKVHYAATGKRVILR